MPRKALRLLGVVVVALAVLGTISYIVVDEYHADSAKAVVASTAQALRETSDSDSMAASSPRTTAEVGVPPRKAATGATDHTATDTSYTDATKSISIGKIASGEGSETVTYYVADVELTAMEDLRAAFSGGGFEARATEDTSEIAAANDAILAINGDHYGAMSDGVIIRNGVLYRNVPARTGLALYEDGSMAIYDETEISAEQLLADGVWSTHSFGPALLVDGDVPDSIGTYEVVDDPKHPIQGINPRTGIGMISNNNFVLVVVDGRQPGYSKGVTLAEFAQIFKGLGCTTAYNLDGGGSSTMYFMGEVINSPAGNRGERAVSDILYMVGDAM